MTNYSATVMAKRHEEEQQLVPVLCEIIADGAPSIPAVAREIRRRDLARPDGEVFTVSDVEQVMRRHGLDELMRSRRSRNPSVPNSQV